MFCATCTATGYLCYLLYFYFFYNLFWYWFRETFGANYFPERPKETTFDTILRHPLFLEKVVCVNFKFRKTIVLLFLWFTKPMSKLIKKKLMHNKLAARFDGFFGYTDQNWSFPNFNHGTKMNTRICLVKITFTVRKFGYSIKIEALLSIW